MTHDSIAPPVKTPATDQSWHARLELNYRWQSGRSVAHHVHEGPLRVLQALYPEGDAICHHVLVHPPGGLVGGDVIEINAQVGSGAHAFITTPGATRFYRSVGPQATQRVRVQLEPGARLEWLPLETIAYSACRAENRFVLALAPGAQAMVWDVLALGLPQSDLPFVQGRFLQHLEVEGAWLERGAIDALDARLMDGPVGLAGHRCLGSLVLAAGEPMSADQVEQALAMARELCTAVPPGVHVGVTQTHPQVLVARVLAPQVEPVMRQLQAIWAVWRSSQWGLTAQPSRMWRV